LRQQPCYRHLNRFFRRKGTVHQVLFYDMALTGEDWWAQAENGSIREKEHSRSEGGQP
jgi:hypothetical protein